MNKRVTFLVSFKLPECADEDESLSYVDNAICLIRGCLRPLTLEGDEVLDDMFDLQSETVKVEPLTAAGVLRWLNEP